MNDGVNRRAYVVALAALAVIAVAAVWVAVRRDPQQVATEKPVHSAADLPVLSRSVPSLDGNKGWLNSSPLSPADLHGKVVLYDFWTYSCINCIRTVPYLQSLYAAYHSKGLEIIGIHSPEFDFEKDHGNVTKAVADLHITWPVTFDDDMAVWRSFGNQYWPAEYLADQDGRIRSEHFGEGDYDQKEDEVRALLGLDPSTPRAAAVNGDNATASAAQTPEMHLGTDFDGPQWCVSPGRYETRDDFTAPGSQRADSFALTGSWLISGQAATTASGDETLVLRYRATEVNAVMASAVPGAVVVVELDGAPVPAGLRPPGMQLRDDGSTVVPVGMSDLYRVLQNGPPGAHTLTLSPSAQTSVFAFTYGTAP